MREHLRGYFFGNFYLSSIQQGIQAAHTIQEMISRQKLYDTPATRLFNEWCEHHKTMVLLNGGAHQSLYELYSRFNSLTERGLKYPIAYFAEETPALSNAITSVGIVIPESVYGMTERMRADKMDSTVSEDHDDILLADLISQYKLAY